MNKKYRHVFRRGAEFTFRLTLAGQPFLPDETWPTEDEAGFAADCFKLFLLRQFKLPAALLQPSLPNPLFVSMLYEAAVDSHNLQDLFYILSPSSKEWIQAGEGEALKERVEAVKGFSSL